MKLNSGSRARRGFTLLEMLVATAMVAILAGSLYASLYIAFKARRNLLTAVDAVRKCNQAVELIKADLQSAVVPKGNLAGIFVGISGGGVLGTGVDSLSFFSAAADVEPSAGIGDIMKIEYDCEPLEGGQMALIRYVTTNLLAPVATEPRQEVICRGVSGFVLRYFDGTTWLDSWDSTVQDNLLPMAVEVTIEFQGGAGGVSSDPGNAVQRVCDVILLPCGQDSSDATAAASGGAS